MSTVLITGAAGFVGRHVVREAAATGRALRVLAHRADPGELPPGTEVVWGDLGDPTALRGLCDGVDTVVHCASQIGGDAATNERVNARGTAALLEHAGRAGVRRLVYLGTASVYGRGEYRAARPEELTRRPGSETSRTRALAEDLVTAAGGTVLRPHIVVGAGDRWVLPTLVRLLRTLPGAPTERSTLHSVITASDLARALVGVALAPPERLGARVYHAAHPIPVPVERLLRAAALWGGVPWPERVTGAAQARAVAAETGPWASGSLEMLLGDHWFDSSPLWSDLGVSPGPPLGVGGPEALARLVSSCGPRPQARTTV
ncbi:NAD-dependent epimerase/dehydratase family protein (plasmid) [Streptomyces sp. BI20]|uniref:NAD-dependent epimerase/dehydratase family protein n=1 Tax=Streptomyces sp. BI20 TaxID=3403460 RepID=UPI003C77C4E7